MHLLEKHHIDIACSRQETAKLFHDEIGDFFMQNLYPKLEVLLDRYDVADRIWKIDKLQVSIPNLSLSNWKNDVLNSSLNQIEDYLKTNQPQLQNSSTDVQKKGLVSKKRRNHELLVTYLIEGSLPQNGISSDLGQIFKRVSIDQEFVVLFVKNLIDSKQFNHVVLRIIYNLPDAISNELAEHLDIIKSLKTLKKVLTTTTITSGEFFKFLFWKSSLIKKYPNIDTSSDSLQFYLTHFNFSKNELLKESEKLSIQLNNIDLNSKQILKIVLDEIQTIVSDNCFTNSEDRLKPSSSRKDEIDFILEALQGNKSGDAEQEHTYINNAGLVILHPFLSSLFNQLGYWDGQVWKEERLCHRAVLLLHYLVYGKSKVYENQLILNKILCGVGTTDTVNTNWSITTAEKAKCEELLLSVIEHWSILKDTSIATLQDTFLQRKAKLTHYKSDNYEMVVEQQSIDVLVDHLPWGIGMVKTPWMNNFLTCLWV
jgi:hypothetical protein